MESIKAIASAISELHSSGKKIVLVVGGGKTARNYVEAHGSLNKFEQDLMGIKLTRANASLLASHIPDANKEILKEIPRAKDILDSGKIPVFGGLMPFFTTDAVAALLAEFLGGNFVNLTNVDGIYDADPREYPDAKRFDEINYNHLIRLITASGSEPGQNVVLDLACCMILKRSSIPGVVLDGNDVENFRNYINGYSFKGTLIKGDAPEPVETESSSPEEPVKKPRRKKKPVGKIKPYRGEDSFTERDVDRLRF